MGCGHSNPKATDKLDDVVLSQSDKPSKEKGEARTFRSVYKAGDVLGEGAFGTVKLATKRDTNEKFAVKIVNRSKLKSDEELALRQEVNIVRGLHHPHIVCCVDFFEENKFYYMVLEYMEGGELFDRIVTKVCYTEKEARDAVRSILEGLEYLHERGIVHRDLKPENLLLKDDVSDTDIKIADFGFATKANGKMMSTQLGTPGYVAPEILENKKYGPAVDMWSVGVIIYILLGGYPPFHDENQRNLFKLIKRCEYEFHPEYWSTVSEDAKSLIRSLLTLDPDARLTAKQALEHPWIHSEDEVLRASSLQLNLKELKRYNVKRKFRAAARAIIAVNRMALLTKQSGKSSGSTAGVDSPSGPQSSENISPEHVEVSVSSSSPANSSSSSAVSNNTVASTAGSNGFTKI